MDTGPTTLSSQLHSGFTAESLARSPSPSVHQPPTPREDGECTSFKASSHPEKTSFSIKYSLAPWSPQASNLMLTQGIQGTWEYDFLLRNPRGLGIKLSASLVQHTLDYILTEQFRKKKKKIKCPFRQ